MGGQIIAGSIVSLAFFSAMFVIYLEFYDSVEGQTLHWTDRKKIPNFLFIMAALSALSLTGCGVFYLVSHIMTF